MNSHSFLMSDYSRELLRICDSQVASGVKENSRFLLSTIFHLTNKELNKDPLLHLERMLETDQAGADHKKFLHQKLFASREDVKELLDEECNSSSFLRSPARAHHSTLFSEQPQDIED